MGDNRGLPEPLLDCVSWAGVGGCCDSVYFMLLKKPHSQWRGLSCLCGSTDPTWGPPAPQGTSGLAGGLNHSAGPFLGESRNYSICTDPLPTHLRKLNLSTA